MRRALSSPVFGVSMKATYKTGCCNPSAVKPRATRKPIVPRQSPPLHRPQAPTRRAKLSYKEQRELESLPDQIAALEKEQFDIRAVLADGQIYSTDPQRAATLHALDAAIEDALMMALERWEALSTPEVV